MALALLATVFIYSQTTHFELLNWDDDKHITANSDLHPLDWEELKSQGTRYVNGNWYPVTMLSFALDLRLAGRDPAWFHGVNMLLHALNGLLAFTLLKGLTRRTVLAATAALFFLVSPTHVESVAWVSARKDLLMAFFGLLSLIAYLAHLRRGGGRLLFLAFMLFVLACLSKAMAVALVPALLLIDRHEGRLPLNARSWLRLVPFLLTGVVIGLVAIDAQVAASALIEQPLGLLERSITAASNLTIYINQQVLPVALGAYHAYHPGDALTPLRLTQAAAAVAILVLAARSKGTIAFGVAFFTINILLVLQFVPVGGVVRADRYTYLPGVGSALAMAGALAWLGNRLHKRYRSAILFGALAIGVVHAVIAHGYCSVWRDSLTLWNDVLSKEPGAVTAYLNRGAAHYARNDHARALSDFEQVLAMAGGTRAAAGTDASEAQAIRNDERYAYAMSNRGLILLQQGEFERAAESFDLASRLRPTAEAFMNSSYCLIRLGRFQEAQDRCDEALRLDPALAMAYGNRALCRARLTDPAGALDDARRFKELAPTNPLADQVLVHALIASGDTAQACATLRAAAIDEPGLMAERERMLRTLCETMN